MSDHTLTHHAIHSAHMRYLIKGCKRRIYTDVWYLCIALYTSWYMVTVVADTPPMSFLPYVLFGHVIGNCAHSIFEEHKNITKLKGE